ncbi:phage protein NinX family protein [Burkholderia gladioli]|uniref:phage protein NinX family protein n=1 Tax=Burkholderia gladioli TaxID=28095 RepID=UPI0016409F87|nr:phage protein NinX family protein [Burkholderia gladioli]
MNQQQEGRSLTEVPGQGGKATAPLMVLVKVEDLMKDALDWAVAKALGCELVGMHEHFRRIAESSWTKGKIEEQLVKMADDQVIIHPCTGNAEPIPAYSRSDAATGPIIDRERIATWGSKDGQWTATAPGMDGYDGRQFYIDVCDGLQGPTRLIAAARCIVASKVGPEIEVPASLLG